MFFLRRKRNKLLFSFFVILILVAVSVYFSFRQKPSENYEEIPEKAFVTKVLDGDTVIIEGGYHIRPLGIDADEKGYPCYEPAKERLEELVLDKEVRLERDKEDKDQYGRYLRYIFLGDKNINLEMVKEGLAISRFYEPNVKYKKEIQEAEEEAIKNKIGCKWKDIGSLRVISACEAQNYIGEEMIVEGKLAQVYQSEKGNVFLNFEKEYPNQCFTVVIFKSDRNRFPGNLEELYLGKRLRVQGLIKEYKGKPEIILSSPSFIKIIESQKENQQELLKELNFA